MTAHAVALGLTALLAASAAVAANGVADAAYTFGTPQGPGPLTVQIASDRAGLTFADNEPVDLRARVAGADGPTVVAYTLAEFEGPWKTTGTVTIPSGAAEMALPVKLPGRGMYTLSLTASAGAARSAVEATLAVLYPPAGPEKDSPWGIFFSPGRPVPIQDMVDNIRRLGSSWVRLNWWAFSYGKVTIADGKAAADSAKYKEVARELRRQGLYIMGEFAVCPRELSSQPDNQARSGDAGPMWGRVPPADYKLWDSMVEGIARDFADSIDVWEVWNEPEIKYFEGTPEQYVELVRHTSAAVKRGNPKALVAAGGFTGTGAFTQRCFDLGIGEHLDIVSFHYSDPNGARKWRSFLQRHKLALPMWNTEERNEVPIGDLAGGVQRVFKFIHCIKGYDGYRPLVNLDLTPRPSAVWYSVGAHCIGSGKVVGGAARGGCQAYYVQRGDERVGVFTGKPAQRKLFGRVEAALRVAAEPLAGAAPVAIDKWGRSRPLELRDGVAEIPWTEDVVFVRGARKCELLDATASATTGDVLVFEAEKGKWSAGWSVTRHEGFSEDRTLDIHAASDPPEGGYWVELRVSVPAAGRYEVLLAGNSLARLKRPRTLSPFTWSIGAGPATRVEDAVKVITGIVAAPEGVSVLGEADLASGEHTFRLKLLGRRDKPDTHYALWFDALALRPVRPAPQPER